MSRVVINRKTFIDKVMGCWLGKNAGGTLGEPVEGKFGDDKMFNIDWYPVLKEGGCPNDDLELQLVFFQILLKRGPGITSQDFAEAWLDCISYNFDEYGLCKENLQKGLLPPVSGWNNNSFKDCMGSPIRSEIWACLNPGKPEVAAHYAFLDAIVDHGGGESVYGECFNAVLESNAFINSDKFQLLETALMSIPEKSLTYRCVRRSIDNFNSGMSYIDNRNDIKDTFYNPISQYSPINLAFQTIGWLYGEDFGDAICKAVNCGWDTDSTAATLGAVLGIINGASGLPKKWIEPLGYEIATNLSTGGIRNLLAPTNIIELTELVCSYAEKMAVYWESDIEFSDTCEITNTVEIESVSPERLLTYKPNEISYNLGTLDETVCYHNDAFILGDRVSAVSLRLYNDHPDVKNLIVNLVLPSGFSCSNGIFEGNIDPYSSVTIDYHITAAISAIMETNTCYVCVMSKGEPAIPAIPIVFLGGSKWLVSRFYSGADIDTDCGVPENKIFDSVPDGYKIEWKAGNNLNIGSHFIEKGVVYALHYIYSYEDKDVVLGVANNGRMKLFLNGKLIHSTKSVVPLRANLGNGGALGDLNNYVVTKLCKGWNQVLIKMQAVTDKQESHFTIGGMSTVCSKNHGMPVLEINRSLFPWEK